jgi:hypothetical protein
MSAQPIRDGVVERFGAHVRDLGVHPVQRGVALALAAGMAAAWLAAPCA